MRFLLNVFIYAILLILASGLMFLVLVGSDAVLSIWDKMRAGDLAGSYIGIPLVVFFALAILIALLRSAFGRKRRVSS